MKGKKGRRCSKLKWPFLVRESLPLSRNTRDPTVGSLWDKKESRSTRRGLRVGTGFREFPQTPRGRGSLYLGFILCLRAMLMFELNEVVRGRLICPKSWDRIVIIFGTSNRQPVQSTDCLCWVCWKWCIKWCFGMYRAGNGGETRVHKVNR